MMSNALFKQLLGINQSSLGDNVTIATYIMPLPTQPMPITIDITSILGGLLYPFALSFLIPVSPYSIAFDLYTVRVENFEVFLISHFSWVADDMKIIHVEGGINTREIF